MFKVSDMVVYTSSLINSLNDAANRDFLTMLPNRRHLELIINKKIKEFEKLSTNFGVIIFDINNFKSINDCFGQNTGDFVLKEFGKTIKENLRKCDIFGRWGGDEFIAVIPNIKEKQLKMISEKLVDIIREKIFVEKKNKIYIIVSAGYSIAKKMDNLDILVGRADKMMYEEKFKNTSHH